MFGKNLNVSELNFFVCDMVIVIVNMLGLRENKQYASHVWDMVDVQWMLVIHIFFS